MPDLKLHVVPVGLIADLWPGVEPLLSRALKHHPHLDSEGLLTILLAGRADLIVAVEGSRILCAAVMEVMRYPKEWTGNIVALAGERGVYLKHMSTIADYLEAWSRAHGCSKISAMGRRGWLRLAERYGWQTQPYLVGFRALSS